jgi:3-deoxy-D-manno-octulosonic-acid transferase
VSPALPAPLVAYRIATTCLAPAAPLWLRWRLRRGKEEPARLGERYGIAARPRPEGDLVWAHGASIGEAMSLLPLVEAMTLRGLKVLVTTGTTTSAAVLARRLPAGARHQFLPLDGPGYMGRFLDHWQPRLGLVAESELWPNMILEADRRRVPLILVNGRMSPRSFARWRKRPDFARALLGRFALCIAQSEGDSDRLAALGAPLAEISGNLKFDLPPPPADPALVEQLAGRLSGREVWMAASTHPGEEAAVLQAHRSLRPGSRRLLTIVAPRHPERGQAVEEAALRMGLDTVRRSAGGSPEQAGDIYVADTVGELGLFLRLSALVFMGGSLVPHGGQNPFEAARLGTPILHGPHTGSFLDIYAALDAAGGARCVEDADGLARAASNLLLDGARLREASRAASETAKTFGGALERTMRALGPYLPPPRDPAEAVW